MVQCVSSNADCVLQWYVRKRLLMSKEHMCPLSDMLQLRMVSLNSKLSFTTHLLNLDNTG